MLQYPTLSLKPSSFPFQQSSANRNMSVRAEVAHLAAPVADGKSLYEVLRVKQNASQVEIKTAYRTLAKLHHPDARARFMNSAIASSPDGRDFMEIHKAYATLSDPDARAEYDLNMSVDSRPRWNSVGMSGGYRSPGRGRFYQTRRWETDQCW